LEEQPELVTECEPETDTLRLPVGLNVPVRVPLTVTLPDTVPQAVAD
jgi:hypothetical protein